MKVFTIIDEQVDFTSGVLGNAECEATVAAIAEYLHANKDEYDEIWLTQDTHHENYLETQEGKHLPIVHCIEGTEGWQIRREILQVAEDIEAEGKPVKFFRKGGFGSRDLAEYAKACYDRTGTLVVDEAGVCTGICDISVGQGIKLFEPEIVVNIIERLCACVTPDTHRIAIEAAKTLQFNII